MTLPLTLLMIGNSSHSRGTSPDSNMVAGTELFSLLIVSENSMLLLVSCVVGTSCVLSMSLLFLLYSRLLALTTYDLGSPSLDFPTSVAGSHLFSHRIRIASPGCSGGSVLLPRSKYSFCVLCLALKASCTSILSYAMGF